MALCFELCQSVVDKTADPVVTCLFGTFFRDGYDDVKANQAEAVRLFRRAAESAIASAMHYLASMIERAYDHVPPDYDEAVRWYRRALDERGNVNSMTNLAYLVERGIRTLFPILSRLRDCITVP